MNAPASLRTPRLLLTRICRTDLDDLVRMYSDPDVTATLGGLRDAEFMEGYLDRQLAHWEQHGFGQWTLRDPDSGRFAGRGGLRFSNVEGRDQVELSYGFMKDCWGRGLATELARESLRIAFMDLRLPELICFTLTTNIASQRVMQKAGFRYERPMVYADLPHVLYRLTAGEWQESRIRG